MDEVFFTEDGDVLVMEYVSLEKYHEMVAQYEHRVAELRKKHAAAAPGEKEGIERQLKVAEKDLQELRGAAHHYTVRRFSGQSRLFGAPHAESQDQGK